MKTKEWKEKLDRNLSLIELNQLKKDLDPIMVDVLQIYAACLYHQNDEVKNLIYEFGFTIKPFQNQLFSIIIENYDVETLIRYVNEGFCLNNIKIKRMIKKYENFDFEIDEDFINYFDSIIRETEIRQKIQKIIERIKDKDSTEDT